MLTLESQPAMPSRASILAREARAASGLLASLERLPPDARPATIGLHLTMTHVRAHWAALHVANDDGSITLVASASASVSGGKTIFDFLADDLQIGVETLARHVISVGRAVAVGRAGAASYGLVESAALSAPVLLADGSPLGSLMLLSTDPMHVRQLESSRRPLG